MIEEHRDALGYDHTQAGESVSSVEFGGENQFLGAGMVSTFPATNRLSLQFR